MSRWPRGLRAITVLGIGLGLLAGLDFRFAGQGAMAIEPLNQAALARLADPTEVRIEGFAFTPADITIQAGTTVRWENFDPSPHTVTSVTPTGLFDSGALGQGDSFSYRFTQPGVYSYHCSLHSAMTGTVTVTGAVVFLPIVMR